MTSERIAETPAPKPDVPPDNPFADTPGMGNRRVLLYHAEVIYPSPGRNSERKQVPMQVFEGMDIFKPVAALLERCRWFEARYAELKAYTDRQTDDFVHETLVEIGAAEPKPLLGHTESVREMVGAIDQVKAEIAESEPKRRKKG